MSSEHTIPASLGPDGKRAFRRVRFGQRTPCRVAVTLPGGRRIPRRIPVDLSLGGCGLIDPQGLLNPDMRVDIELDLRESVLMVQGTVVWRGPEGRVGLHFVADVALISAWGPLVRFLERELEAQDA